MKECVITFNGISFADYGVYFNSGESLAMPEQDVETYSVVGRNGDLIIPKDRYKNINIPFECYIKENFVNNFKSFLNMFMSLNSYGRLETTLEPDVYRMAFFSGGTEPKIYNNDFGEFTLNFNCKPQKWLKSGENKISISSSLALLNPTSYDAKPLIEVTGTGTITINSSVLTLATNTSTTMIDCELQDCYEGTINRNSDLTVVGGFPVLTETNNISFTGFTSVKLTPRWWRL